MLAILDYKAGNQTSVLRALSHLGIEAAITADPDVALTADGLIFPGVGAAGQAMHQLRESGLDAVLKAAIAENRPLLGICLGCQILLSASDENDTNTLGLFPGRCLRFDPALTDDSGAPLRIPHMGWNTLTLLRPDPLFAGIDPQSAMYFVHGYHVDVPAEHVLATSHHGLEFCAAYGRAGFWGVQFHPEKSGRPGLAVLDNFNRYCLARKESAPC